MSATQEKSSTVEIVPSVYEVDTAASLDKPVTYAVYRPEFTKGMSLIRAISMATILPFAKLDAEFFRNRGYGAITQSPYVALVEDEHEEGVFTPILGFSLGGPHIVIPKRATLNSAALRALAVGRVIMNPIVLDFEE